jgi:transposase
VPAHGIAPCRGPLTSNLPFARWGQVFGEATIASAMIDRIVHHADVIALKGASYRIKHPQSSHCLPSKPTVRQTQPRKHTCSLFNRVVSIGRRNTSPVLEVVLSSRRVKKVPGRRPQSAKRRRFVELRGRGWSILAAAREVGVSRTTGNNWSRGYKTYRHGTAVGFVPALDRLAVREISARFLSQDERFEIADLHRAGSSIRAIARELGRAPSTISRELRRNTAAGRDYRPFDAHRRATARRTRRHRLRLDSEPELRGLVTEPPSITGPALVMCPRRSSVGGHDRLAGGRAGRAVNDTHHRCTG